MKNKNINIKTITIIVLIGIIIILILINLNIKNTNILQQEITKEQLTEATSDNSYVEMQTHLSEIKEQEEKLLSFKSKIAEAITNKGIETSVDDTAETMVKNINNIGNSATAVKLGTGTAGTTFTMSVTNICPNYADLTAANFLMELNTIQAQVGWNTNGWDTMVSGYSKTYDAAKGTITVSINKYAISTDQNQGKFTCTFSVWLVNA